MDALEFDEPEDKTEQQVHFKCQALYDYDGLSPKDLNFVKDDVIIITVAEGEWWFGELNGKTGFVPHNYVKKIKNMDQVPGERVTSAAPSQGPQVSRYPQPSASRNEPENKCEQVPFKCKALYDYEARSPLELNFVEDDVIIITKAKGEWWEGELNEKNGLVPYNYVKKIENEDQVQAELSAVQPEEHLEYTTEGREFKSNQGSKIYDYVDVMKSVLDDKKKRQNLIDELVNSEKAYVHHILQTSQQFYTSLESSGLLAEEEFSAIYDNFKEVLQCNMKLEKNFSDRVKKSPKGCVEKIGDLLSRQLDNFVSPYSKFCDQQARACQLVQQKIKTWNSSKKSLQKPKGCLDPRIGQLLINDLQKPLERILWYERLITKLLKYTPEDHPDHSYLQSALKNAVKVSKKVERFQSEQTSNGNKWLQSHINQRSLLGLFIFKTSTESLERRKLIYTGRLYEVKSDKELKAFLFNDFLLLMQPESSLTGAIMKKKPQSKKPGMQYTIYKNPLFLKELIVTGRPDFNSEDYSFQISFQDEIYSFKTDTGLEREKWIKNLEKTAECYIQTEKKKEGVRQKGEYAMKRGKFKMELAEFLNNQAEESERK